MSKLYSLEDNSNDLLIDRILAKNNDLPKKPLSLTADILKQQEQITKEVSKQLTETKQEDTQDTSTEEETSDSLTSDTEVSNDNQTKEDKESSKEDTADDTTQEKEDEDEKSSSDDEKEISDSKDDEDEGSVADSQEDLDKNIGSELSKSNSPSPKPKEDKELATESLVTTSNIFTPVIKSYLGYRVSLEQYNLSKFAISVENKPIVYVKDSVLESLNRLILVSSSYIENNNNFVEAISRSFKELTERYAVFSTLVANRSYNFTNKLVSDKDILTNISFPGKSNPRDTIKVLNKYLANSIKSVSLLISNQFSDLISSFTNNGYISSTENKGNLAYEKTLPGFITVQITIPAYINYLKTKIDEYQYYKLKTAKSSDIFNLPSIGITEDKELDYVITNLAETISYVTTSIDSLSAMSSHFTEYITEIKAVVFDVGNNKYENLKDIGLDSKIQDFIKYKLAIEAYYININIAIDYITSITSVFDEVVELKDVK